MRRFSSFFCVAVLFCSAGFASAGQGGTLMNTYNFGGSMMYDSASIAGSKIDLSLHTGMYYRTGLLLGIAGAYFDDDFVNSYQIAALAQYHFLDTWLVDSEGRPSAFSPYVGVLLGFASGKNYAADDSGIMAGARLGCNFFLTDNFAFTANFDAYACSGDVYADDGELSTSDAVFTLGFDVFF